MSEAVGPPQDVCLPDGTQRIRVSRERMVSRKVESMTRLAL